MSTQSNQNPILSEIHRLRDGLDRLELWARDIERAYFVTHNQKTPTVHEVLMRVCDEWGIFEVEHLKQHSNMQRAVEPRQVAAYVMQKLMKMSLAQIGKTLGAFHHTTVLHGIRKVEERMTTDAAFKARVEVVMGKLQ